MLLFKQLSKCYVHVYDLRINIRKVQRSPDSYTNTGHKDKEGSEKSRQLYKHKVYTVTGLRIIFKDSRNQLSVNEAIDVLTQKKYSQTIACKISQNSA